MQDIAYFFEPIINFFKDTWNQIYQFLLQYMSSNTIMVFIFGIGIALVLIIVLALMNRK